MSEQTAAPLGEVVLGQDRPGRPLVVVHGLLLGGRLSLEGPATTWARRRRVVVVDRPGFERTPGDPVDIATQAARLVSSVTTALAGVDADTVDLLGVDVGGLVVLRALEQVADRVAHVVLVDVPAPDLCPADMVEPTRLLGDLRQAHDDGGDPDHVAAAMTALLDPALRAVATRLWARRDPGLTPLHDDLAVWAAQLDRAALADAVSGDHDVAVLTVSGGLADPAMRTFGACAAAALLGCHQHLPGAGHLAHIHPRFADLLQDHLGDPD